ncbi:MAG TPA: hypothetical protein VJ111_16530 [Chitinophagaceae bacterium]|nr:hypothetical protein [Chitinophagaceae bacterium]
MPFPKNIAFTSLIKVNGRLREFNFRQRGISHFDIDTTDERGNRYFFKMEKQEKSWKICDANLPGWIMENERLVAEAASNNSII